MKRVMLRPIKQARKRGKRDDGRMSTQARLVVEGALGKPLPVTAVIHHIDLNPGNDGNTNLVACEDHEYHFLLHMRQKALVACGHASWRQCDNCKTWGDPARLLLEHVCGDCRRNLTEPGGIRRAPDGTVLEDRKVCPRCGGIFRQRRKKHEYCTKTCAWRAWDERNPRGTSDTGSSC